ncbi:MAG: hypothetical protein ABSB60_00915 [Terracidiphilus sp.]
MQMTVPGRTIRTTTALLLSLFAVSGSVRLNAQKPSEVQLDDDSDWWSITRSGDAGPGGKLQAKAENIQDREIPPGNFTIVGIDIRNGALAEGQRELGDATVIDRATSGAARGQRCYVSESGEKVYLIVEEGEFNSAFYLFSETPPWKGKEYCARSNKISKNLATDSGLRLGQSVEEVTTILGAPSENRGTELMYLLKVNRPTPPAELFKLRTQTAALSDQEFQDKFGLTATTAVIRAKFSHSKLDYLAISVSQTR